MTRRGFFSALVHGSPAFIINERDGFIVTGHLTEGGEDPRHRYYAIGQSLTLMIDARKLPECASGADALLGGDVTITLTRANG